MVETPLNQPVKIPPELTQTLRQARRIVVLTGAGVSAESGVPTFRDAQSGFWANFRPEDLATPEAFERNPKLVWDWYAMRREMVAAVAPNPAHFALAELEKRTPEFHLFTQNVDGLHQRAGSRQVIELHGNITRVKCFKDGAPVGNWPETGETPPHCPRCGGRLRPDVVWFGESLPEAALQSAMTESARCDVFLSIGTSTQVYPAASLPFLALDNSATVVEINPIETSLSDRATHSLRGPAGKILPQLIQALGA